jgi:hypothetical protein
MPPQFIYVMKGLRKVVPPSRVILDDIWLSFYPGAKIGVGCAGCFGNPRIVSRSHPALPG